MSALEAMKAFEKVLKKLRVRPALRAGLRGELLPVSVPGVGRFAVPPWRLGFWFESSPSSRFYVENTSGFYVELRYETGRTQMDLQDADVETRGRSRWRTENTWRLSAAGIAKVMKSLRDVIPEIEARTKEYNESALVIADAILEGQSVDWDALPAGTARALVKIRDRFLSLGQVDAAQALTLTMLRAQLQRGEHAEDRR